MAAVLLFVDKPVASLQFDLDTQGTVTLKSGINKDIITNRLPNGRLRVLIYRLNQDIFNGEFAACTDYINSIENIIGADANGVNANVSVGKLSAPINLQLHVIR